MNIATKARLRALYLRLCDTLHRTAFARPDTTDVGLLVTEITQPFLPSATLESKKHNLREAARCINVLTIQPGQVFSFWHAVGNPNNRKRFSEGRSIHHGKLSLDVGGGLCQASGIIHHLALLVGLHILERHNHSVDLYADDARFCPLGSDATVFYGFKDLRLRNNLSTPIRLKLIVETDQLRAQLFAKTSIPTNQLTFQRTLHDDGTKYVRVTDQQGNVLSTSVYESL